MATQRTILRYGDGIRFPEQREQVKQLQRILKELGFLGKNTSIDGKFGIQTEEAVKEFQESQKLLVDGVVGNNTWISLDLALARAKKPPVLKKGDGIVSPAKREEVKVLQLLLRKVGVLPKDAPIDGLFGEGTEAAVKEFQETQNLTADGVVGEKTWEALEDPKLPVQRFPVLRKGDGIDYPQLQDEVKQLQALLKKAGFLPADAPIDGLFGENTENALKRFQESEKLTVDGLAGANTWSALVKEPVQTYSPYPANILSRFDLDRIVSSIPYSHIRPYARTSIPIILTEATKAGIVDKGQLAYILATAFHESHLGRLMEEFASGWAYEWRRDLGNVQRGDGPKYKGRGFVQITGRRNYSDWSRRLGIDLINNPEKALEPEIAAKILVQGSRDGTFTGRKLEDDISGVKRDYYNARRIINGLDRATEIAAIAQNFYRVL